MGVKGDNARLKIIECAHSLFCQKGYSGVTMKDICELSGFSRGGLYRHYSSTEEIFMDIIRFEQSKAYEALENARMRELEPDTVLYAFLRSRMRRVAEPSHSFDVAVSEFAANSEKGRQLLIKRAEDSVGIITELIKSGNAVGAFKCSDPRSVASHIIWLIEGMSRHSSLLTITDDSINSQIELIKILLFK